MHRAEYLADFRQDVMFAIRTLRRQRAWSAVAIVTLALGIGATTAVFSVVSALLLHPLPYPNADRVVFVAQQPSEGNTTGGAVTVLTSAPMLRLWRESRSFEALEGFLQTDASFRIAGAASTVSAAAVSPTFPDFAGERPILGRMFTASDISNGTKAVLLGESFWRKRFDADRSIVGHAITLDDTPHIVLGILPRGLQVGGPGDAPPDLWLPLDIQNDETMMSVVGRLRPGTAVATATAELNALYARSIDSEVSKIPFKALIETPVQQIRFRESLLMLAGASAFVLLIACTNVAHLMLSRSAARQRELAIRGAVGAGRSRLFRQLLTESLLVSFGGTVCGVFLGVMVLRILVALRPESLDALRAAHLDLATLGIATVSAVVSGIVFGFIGGTQAARYATSEALKNGSLASSSSKHQRQARALLVVSEMALSAILLVGATLLVQSVMQLQRTDLGYNPKALYNLSVPLEESGITSLQARAAFIRDFMTRLEGMPAVLSTSLANAAPGSRWFHIGRLEIEGEPAPPRATSSFIDVNQVQSGYFATMGIRFSRGATFTDTTSTTRQVIVNETFARKHWRDPIGKRIRIARSDTTPWMTIVGVVNDARTSGPTGTSSAPMLYSPLTRMGGTPNVLVRTTRNADALAAAASVLMQMGVREPAATSSVEQMMRQSIAGPRFMMMLLTLFTALALALAGIGLYGVMAHSVGQQSREIGIRMALGASGIRIAGAVVGRGTALALTGAAIGLTLALWSTKLLENQLHGVGRLDPASFVVGGSVLVGVAILACMVPTRRALSVDPVTAIRAD